MKATLDGGITLIQEGSLRLTVLCDDRLTKPLFSEHGFSVLVEQIEEPPILFDTGANDVFIKNAKILGKDLMEVEKVVISHGHYDHAGGLRHLSKLDKKFEVYVGQEIFTPKYSDERFIGVSWEELEQWFKFITVKDKVKEISHGIYIFGHAEMKNDFEEPDSNFYILKNGQKVRDFFDEEMNLVIDQGDGVILITGCAHRGIVNTVEDVLKTFDKKIKVLIGGFHLYKSSLQKLEKVTTILKDFGIGKIIPYHCTGEIGIKLLKSFNM